MGLLGHLKVKMVNTIKGLVMCRAGTGVSSADFAGFDGMAGDWLKSKREQP